MSRCLVAVPSCCFLLLSLLACLSSAANGELTRHDADFYCAHFEELPEDQLGGAGANRIVRENCLSGNASSDWDVNGAGDPRIQGYSTDISYNVGQTAEFKVKTDSKDWRIDIFRAGYYRGLGARHVATVRPDARSLEHRQPNCTMHQDTWTYECGKWQVSARWAIPKHSVSGYYLARVVRSDGETVGSWRADNSVFTEDPRFAMPDGTSLRPPKKLEHAYGALGHGKLRNPIKEPKASLIYFIVRDEASRSDIVIQAADTVWQAYNNEGGPSTYGAYDVLLRDPNDASKPHPRVFKASLNRPLRTRQDRPVNAFLGSEFPIIRFMEANGYDVTYQAGVDTDRYGAELLRNHRVFLSIAHDEYWSQRQRDNVVEARDRHGVHLGFFSGNEMYWRVRWEDSYRTMVVYKESQSPTKIDPQPEEWTGTFRDARDINPLGPQPENAVTGQIFTMNAWRNDPLIVPHRFAQHRQWRHTKVSRLRKGQKAVLFRGILGHEMDEDVDNGYRPANMIHLSETPIDNVMYIQDHGSTFDSGSATHRLTLYRAAASGALVFGAGTCQWGWALDGMHDGETQVHPPFANPLNIRVGHDPVAPDVAVQQFTVNLLADMGAQPHSIAAHLTPAAPSSDRSAPTCRVESVALDARRDDEVLFLQDKFAPLVHVAAKPGERSPVPASRVLRVVVTARDLGGGIVAGVEVREGNNERWRPAAFNGTDSSAGPQQRCPGGAADTTTRWVAVLPYDVSEGTALTASSDVNVWCRATDDSLNTQRDASVYSHVQRVAEEERKAKEKSGKKGTNQKATDDEL